MRTGTFAIDVLVNQTPTSFTIPKNSRIDSIIVEKRGTAEGNIVVGTSAEGPTYEKLLLGNITDATGSGTISISLRGGPVVNILVERGDTGAKVAQAIAEGSYPGYTAAADGNSVTFTSEVSGEQTGDNVITYGDTGVTPVSFTVSQEGKDTVYEVQALEVTGVPSLAGNIYVEGVEVALTLDDSPEDVAAKIASKTYTDWVAVQGEDDQDAFVYFTSKLEGDQPEITVLDPGVSGTEVLITVETPGDFETAEVVTLEVETAPAADGLIVVCDEDVSVNVGYTAVDVATAIFTAFDSHAYWGVAQGSNEGVDDHIITFTAQAVGEVGENDKVTFKDVGTEVVIGITEKEFYAAATSEELTLPAPGAPSSAGNITITLDSGVYVIPVEATTTAAEIKTAILGTSFDGWTVSEDNGDIIFTSDVPGDITVTSTISFGTGVTSDVFAVTAGKGWVVDGDVVAEVALSKVHESLTPVTVLKQVFDKGSSKVLVAGVTGNATAILHIMLERFL